jgi:hypothetical protein
MQGSAGGDIPRSHVGASILVQLNDYRKHAVQKAGDAGAAVECNEKDGS